MKSLQSILLVLMIGALAAAFVGWTKVSQLRSENEALLAENEALRAQSATVADAQSQQRDQEMERLRAEAQDLQKLRNEVSRLRAGSKELDRLRAENQQLRSAVSPAPDPANAPVPPAAPPGSQFPRENWAFSGYASPEAALISAVWAMREGDPKTYLASLSPEEQERMAKTWENASEGEVAAKHQKDVADITGVRVLEKQLVSPTEIVMDVYVEGVGRMEKVSMKRVATEWKFGGFIRAPQK